MRVIYVSNFLNFHQTVFWDEFIKNPDVDFVFLSTVDHSSERAKAVLDRPYGAKSYSLSDIELKTLLHSSDVLIVGACNDKRIFRELPRYHGILFHNSEHYWKSYRSLLGLAKRIGRMFEIRRRYRKTPPFFLANSSRLRQEMVSWRILKQNRLVFRFGYYPPVNVLTPKKWSEKKDFVFVGRILKWKRPEHSIAALDYVRVKKGIDFSLTFYGEGEYINKLKKSAARSPSSSNISFRGFISHDEVISAFNDAACFVFSSNKQEGWGAVLNEAMSCGVIVFASSEAGASKYLIQDGINGYLYRDISDLYQKIDLFFSLPAKEKQLISINAQKTISDLWNEKTASARLFAVLHSIRNNEPFDSFSQGPLSIDRGDN